ncbi:MAG: Dihydroxy-acid dehydratase, partial [uncultured Thermoleophilia bacterium]
MTVPTWAPRAAALLPLALLPLVALVLARTGRSYEPAVWYPWALLVLALPVVVLLSGRRAPLGRVPAAGLALAALYAGWQYLSIAWADIPGAALLEANRSAVYAAAVGVVVLLVDTPARRRMAVVAVSAASAFLALGYVVRLLDADGTASLFLFQRLAMPIGYPSATAAFLLIGLWPLVTLSVDPEAPPWLRVLAGGGAALLPATAVLTQSRGGLLFLGLSAAVFFVASPLRARATVPMLIGLGGAALTFDTLDRPFGAESPQELEAAARDAAQRILALGAVGTVVALTWTLVDRAGLGSARVRAAVGRGVVVLVAVAALVAAAGALRADAPTRVADYWETFRSGGEEEVEGTRLFSSAGSNRYDFWRGALVELRERPLTGYGAGNFGWRYLQIRDSTESPTNAHGELFEAAATGGVPGLLLYGGSIAAGRYEGEDISIQEVFEAVGKHAAGTITREQL